MLNEHAEFNDYYPNVSSILENYTPIQLPTDEDIHRNRPYESISEWGIGFHSGWKEGAKWMRDKIKGGDDLQYSKEEMYYIQNGFSGNAIIWWAKDSKGYTSNLNEAGKYTKEQAFNQVALNRGGEYAWLCSYVDGIENKPVCMFGSTLDVSQRIDYKKIKGGQGE
jgi:hypothetical protein